MVCERGMFGGCHVAWRGSINIEYNEVRVVRVNAGKICSILTFNLCATVLDNRE